MKRPKDARSDSDVITREQLWESLKRRGGYGRLCRLARFVGIAFVEVDTPATRWSLVESLYAVTRAGKGRKAA